MTMHWRYLESDGVSAAGGLAYDEALMLHYGWNGGRNGGRDEVQNETAVPNAALRLYTYRPHCALVGRFQSIADEIDLAYCDREDFQVGRRATGGGAIIMGPGQLGVAIAARAPVGEGPREVLRCYARGVIAGLAGLGIEAQFRSKNDLEVGGRKIAGLGLYLDPRGALLFHASVLVDLDVALMLAALRIPGAKISDKGVARVGERVTTISNELNRQLTASDVRECFAEHLATAFGATLTPSQLDAEETSRQTELLDSRYGDESWLFQTSTRQDSDGSALLKGPEGLLRIHVGLHGEVIKHLLLAGDFNVMPAALTRLESALRWCRASPEAITRAAREALRFEPEAETTSPLGLSPEAVARAIWRATLNAQRHQRRSQEGSRQLNSSPSPAHPKRSAGSCYFPEAERTPSSGEIEERAR